MIITIKKRTILIALAFVLGASAVCYMFSASYTASSKAPKNGKIVVIDAGHGGIDGGVSGTKTGTKESDINLAIARSLKHFLVSGGYEVVMTRSTTDGLYGMASKNRKLKDMEARRQIIEESKPDLVISIHQNSYPRSSERGAQVFYAPTATQTKQLAESMQKTLSLNLETKRLARPGDYFILQCSSYPSLLIECGFLTNAEEEKLLISATYQEKVAYAIYSGIHTILNIQN